MIQNNYKKLQVTHLSPFPDPLAVAHRALSASNEQINVSAREIETLFLPLPVSSG